MRITRRRSYGRDAGVLAGGVILGAMASRLVPPVAAMVSGAVRGKMGESPFELLRSDHRSVLALLEKMKQMPDDAGLRRSATLLAFKRALSKHALAEEDVVYP